MKKFNLLLFSILVGAIFLPGTFPAVYAQDEEEKNSEEFTLEEITVTAEKREENLQAVPRSLAVISADELNIRSSDQVQDMIANTAGISFVAGGPWLNHIGMRGVIPNTAETGTEAAVQFSVDGNVALSSENSISPMFSAMNDVERVEIIRGPSGAISGRMAAVGSVRVVTKDPDFEKYDGYVGYTTGKYNVNNAKAAINLPLKLTGLDLPSFIENMAVRFAVTQDKHSEYIHNSAGEGVSGSSDYFTWRAKLKWQPIEDLTLNLQMSFNRDKSNNQMGVPLIEDGNSPHKDDPWLNANAAAATEPNESIQWNESATVNWSNRLGNLTARYNHSWIPVNCDEQGGGGPPPPGGVCYDGEIGQQEYEIYMASPDDSKLRWMIGGYMFHKKEYAGPDSSVSEVDLDALTIGFSDFYGGGGGPPGTINPWTAAGYNIQSPDFPANNPEIWLDTVGQLGGEVTGDSIYYYSNSATRPIDSYSYYANLTIPFAEDTQRVTFGFRENFEKKKRLVTFAIIGRDPDSPYDMPHFTFDDDRDQWVVDNYNTIVYQQDPVEYNTNDKPRNITLGYEWDVKPEVMLYTNINNGFKPGGISLNSIPNVFYKPEKSMNYAIGTRSRWFDNTVQLNLEAYLMTYENYQINIASEGVLTNTIDGVEYTQPYRFQSRTMNMGKTNIYGLELDYTWLITGKDRVKGNFEYKHAYYGDLDINRGVTANPPGSAQYVSYGGRVMQNSPKFTFYASYNHRFDVGNIMVTPTLDARWSSKYFCNSEPWWEVSAPNEIWQPSYIKYDAYLNIAPSNGKWQINAYGKNLTETVIRNMVGNSANIEAPRTYGLGMTVNF